MNAREELERIIDTSSLSEEEVISLWRNWYDQDLVSMPNRWRKVISRLLDK